MGTKEKIEGTIFDDVYRSMAQKMTFLMIPLINEVFGQTYAEDEKIETLRTEHYEPKGKIITDSIFRIKDRLYHIECQSTRDGSMALRMLEYDFAIALDHAELDDEGNETITFPSSCVVYVRNHHDIPDEHTVTVKFPDGETFKYKAKTIQISRYSPDEIFSKHLYVFLPYFILRYEHFVKSKSKDPKKTGKLMDELKSISAHLELDMDTQDRALYTDILGLVSRIMDYIVPDDFPERERMDKLMGGQILELLSEKQARLENERNAAVAAAAAAEAAAVVAEKTAEETAIKERIAISKKLKATGMSTDQIASIFDESCETVDAWLNSVM